MGCLPSPGKERKGGGDRERKWGEDEGERGMPEGKWRGNREIEIGRNKGEGNVQVTGIMNVRK